MAVAGPLYIDLGMILITSTVMTVHAYFFLSVSADIFPITASALGGTLLTISGPCFDDFSAFECNFGDEAATNAVFASNSLRAYCPVPMLNRFGPVRLALTGRKLNGQSISYPERSLNASELYLAILHSTEYR